MSKIPLPQRPGNSAGKQVWVNYCAAHGMDMAEARGKTVKELQDWRPSLRQDEPQPVPVNDPEPTPMEPEPPVQKVDTSAKPEPVVATFTAIGDDEVPEFPVAIGMDLEQWRHNHPLNIQDAILETMKLVGAVGKNERNNTPGASYSFRGVDTTVNAVAPAFKMFGVTISPKVVHCTTSRAPKDTNTGNVLLWADVIMEYTLEARDGSKRVWSAPGAAMDTGDKAIGKACSVAYRIAMLQGLCIPTDEPDPDSVSYGHDDPDGGRVYGRDANRAQQPAQRQERGSQRPDYTDPQQGPKPSEAQVVRDYTLRVMSEYGWTGQDIRDRYHEHFKVDYLEETDVARMKEFGKDIRDTAIAERAREEEEAVANVLGGLGGRVIDDPDGEPGEEQDNAGSPQD